MNKYTLLTGILSSFLFGSILPYSIYSSANNEDISASYFKNNKLLNKTVSEENFDDERVEFIPNRSISYSDAVSEISILLDSYNNSPNIDTLKKCILTFGEIPKISKSLTNNTVKKDEQLKELFNSIRLECYNLDSLEDREVCVKMFAEEIFLGWKYDKNIEHFKEEFLINGLIDYNKDKLVNIQERLDYLLFVIDFYNKMGDPFPEYNFIPDIDEPVYPNPSPDDENILPDDNHFFDDAIVIVPDNNNQGNNNSNNDSNDGVENNTLLEEMFTVSTHYQKIENKCYKVTNTLKNGVVSDVEKILADKSEYVYCGIYDYVNIEDGYASGHVIVDHDYLNNNQNEFSEYYVYYTITNDKKAPYYYNSGIRADAISKIVSYNQLKDIFYNLAIKNKSFSIDDNDKSLYIFNGTPLVLTRNTKDIYTQGDIDKLLKPFKNLGVRIMKQKDYDACQIKYEQSQVNKDITYFDTITVDGTTINEKEIAWIEDDVLRVSIRTIANLLNAKTSINNNVLIIEKNNYKIEVYNNKKEYTVNNERKSFSTLTIVKNGYYISELADIPQLLGYNVEFDVNTGLVFTEIK